MAIAHQSYSDILREHLHMQIHENLATNTRVLQGRAVDGKAFMVGIDNMALATARYPQDVVNNAAQQLQNAINQHNQSLAGQWAHQNSQYQNATQQQMNMLNQQSNYLNQLAQAHPIIAQAAEEVEEIEEEVVKEVYKAAFEWRRFFDKLMTLPIAFIDRLAALA